MKRTEIATIEKAARRLAGSQTTLKSIMSTKGTPRYGPETLKKVLKLISSEKA